MCLNSLETIFKDNLVSLDVPMFRIFWIAYGIQYYYHVSFLQTWHLISVNYTRMEPFRCKRALNALKIYDSST